MSDLHLPLGKYKPMDVFGNNWDNYVERIEKGWKDAVKEDDAVIINGDISWATYIDDALSDFKFIASLPGIKLISKGNHDYWWETQKKLTDFLIKNDICGIYFIHNSSFLYKDCAICASRGWITPNDKDFKESDRKMYERELGRLRLSLKMGAEKNPKGGLIAALHYPPEAGFIDILDEFGVKMCVYGHLHGKSAVEHKPKRENFHLVSADFLRFKPKLLLDF